MYEHETLHYERTHRKSELVDLCLKKANSQEWKRQFYLLTSAVFFQAEVCYAICSYASGVLKQPGRRALVGWLFSQLASQSVGQSVCLSLYFCACVLHFFQFYPYFPR